MRYLFAILTAGLTTTASLAQKLPNIQLSSVAAPFNLKIDGKDTEWGDGFQAHNAATDLYYTLANDQTNLYLIIQAQYKTTVRAALNGGITFTIGNKEKKNGAKHLSITYPVYEGVKIMHVVFKSTVPGRDDGPNAADSLMRVNNARMVESARSIKVLGINGVDTLISVYNADGIKAAGGFNNKPYYTYELCLPLKYIQSTLGVSDKFQYQIMVNAVQEHGITIERDANDKVKRIMIQGGSQTGQDATDFWGEYTLAKKP